MYVNLAIIAGFLFLYSIASGWFERTAFNGAVVFTAFGLLVGPLGLGFLHLDIDAELLRTLAELTLALVLFTDASTADISVLKKNFAIPQRLLLLGLPLTIVAGFFFGFLVFDSLTIFEIAILATMLAPTDAALGKAVVTDQSVPSQIREGLNVESGLNDGICVPIIFVFLALVAESGAEQSASMITIKLVVEQIGIGVAVGCLLALAGSWLLNQFSDRGLVTETWRQIPVIALAVSCFAVAQSLGGSGFIASFVGGLLFGGITHRHKHSLLLAAEGTGDTLALITWVVFGSAVVGQTASSFSWQVVVYAVLSLTVVRMLPVFLALAGMNIRADEKLFMGWFGPRGLASIVFAVIVLDEKLPGGETIGLTVVCTIILSIIGHGISAKPFVNILKNRLERDA